MKRPWLNDTTGSLLGAFGTAIVFAFAIWGVEWSKWMAEKVDIFAWIKLIFLAQ